MKEFNLFPIVLFCAECGKPVEGIRWWSSLESGVRCNRCSENWDEAFEWY